MISELTAVLNGPLKGYQFFFLKYHIGALLDRLDRCSMFQSVEARVPFLSKNLIRYALKTNFADPRVYVDGRMMGKAMLREFLLKRTNPEMAFRGKVGFPNPLFSNSSTRTKKTQWITQQTEAFLEKSSVLICV